MLRTGAGQLRHRGARHWAAPFVLAMLCLRAFVPAGFMLAPVDGQPAIVLCDSDASGGGAHAHHHSDPSHPHGHPDPTCPYAQSSGPAPLPVLPALAAVQTDITPATPVESGQTRIQFGPERQQTPRGPPTA